MRIALTALLVALAGCRQPNASLPPLPPPVQGAVRLTPLSRPPGKDERGKVLIVRLRLVTLQLPIGSVSDSEELWSYLNEEPAGARVGAGLAYNGIRVGLGPASAWADVAKVLRRLSGRELRHSHAVARSGEPLPIVLKKNQPKQTVFIFRPDRTLYGRDYPRGDNVLMMTAAINWEDPSRVHLLGMPLIRSARRRTRYVKGPTGYVVSSQPDYYPLKELGFRFTVPGGGFVLIGPGPEVRRESSPGHHFLIRRKKGAKFETILLIAPEVFAAPVRGAD